MPPRKYSDEKIKELNELYGTMSINELSKITKIPHKSIYTIMSHKCHCYNHLLTKKNKPFKIKFNDNQIKIICDMWNEGKTSSEIQKVIKITQGEIYGIVNGCVSCYKHVVNKYNFKPHVKYNEKQIKVLIDNYYKLTAKEIEELTGIGKSMQIYILNGTGKYKEIVERLRKK